MTPLGVVLIGLFGLMVGSFLNVCISRLPAGESVVHPGSRCPACRTPIKPYDNIPVVSYLMLGGRCRSCKAGISLRYPLVELATGAAFATDALVFGDTPWLLVSRLVFTSLLVTLFGTDLETQRLPNVLTIPGLVVGLAASLVLPPGLRASAAGVALGGGVLFAIRAAWKSVTGVDAMGLGDVKMLGMVGAFLGWRGVVVTLFFASVAGALAGVALTVFFGRSMRSKLAFGTFLALAAFAASLIGDALMNWYLHWYQ